MIPIRECKCALGEAQASRACGLNWQMLRR